MEVTGSFFKDEASLQWLKTQSGIVAVYWEHKRVLENKLLAQCPDTRCSQQSAAGKHGSKSSITLQRRHRGCEALLSPHQERRAL